MTGYSETHFSRGYQKARWTGVGPLDTASGLQSISFETEDGSRIRLLLDSVSVASLVDVLNHYEDNGSGKAIFSQSDMPSGSSHSEGSPQLGQNVEPDTKSSSAECGLE